MRLAMAVMLIAVSGMIAAQAAAQSFHAGVVRLAVPGDDPFDVLVAYPTRAAEEPVEVGPVEVSAARDAPVAPAAGDGRLPVVLFSHGGGRTAGTPLLHRGLLLHLAREGFIVVAPFHTAARRPFEARPRQVQAALGRVLEDPRFADHADASRLGMVGYSFGGAVALLAAGAKLDLAHLSRYCGERRDDPRACDGIPTDGSLAGLPARASAAVLALDALVLLEPYGAPFDAAGLAGVDIAVLIGRAGQSDLRAEGNALAVAAGLPRPPVEMAVPGTHFVFVDPCPPSLAAAAPALCDDPPGVDRAAIHRDLHQRVAHFLRTAL